MDFDDTCYALDIIYHYVIDFIQDTWMKDELSKLLNEEKPPDGVEGENHHHNVIINQVKEHDLNEHKTPRHPNRWEKFVTKKKKKNIPGVP